MSLQQQLKEFASLTKKFELLINAIDKQQQQVLEDDMLFSDLFEDFIKPAHCTVGVNTMNSVKPRDLQV